MTQVLEKKPDLSEMQHPQISGSKNEMLVWSASPTPFLEDGSLDFASISRCINHHVRLGCDGIMLGGTCGEGPWLTDVEIEKLVRAGLEAAGGRIAITAQATDNSPSRILERLEKLASYGVSTAVIAQPYFLMNSTEARLREFYIEVLDRSPLPIILYDRGRFASVPLSHELVGEILHHPKIIMEKDSSSDPSRWKVAQSVRASRPELLLLNGDEFQLLPSLDAGFHGAFFGGAILTAAGLRRCVELLRSGKAEEASILDARMQNFLWDVYGGRSITCWLGGLKHVLVQLGVFSTHRNILGYPLTAECRLAIEKNLPSQRDWLLPNHLQ